MSLPIGFCGSITKSGVGYQARGFIKLLNIKHILEIATPKTPLHIPGTELFQLSNENIEDQVEFWIKKTGIKAIVYEEIPYSGIIVDTAKRLGTKNYVSANFESGRLSEFNWSNVEAVISKTIHNIHMLQNLDFMKTRFHYLPPFFDEEEFVSVKKMPDNFDILGHMMGYGKLPRFGEAIVENSPMGTGEILKALEFFPIYGRLLKIFAMPKSIYRKSLEAISSPHVEVVIKEFDSPAEIISQAGMFIQPSHVEGFGRTYFETMGCGRPTFTINAPPMNEICPFPEMLIEVEEKRIVSLGKEKREYEYVIPSAYDLGKKLHLLKDSTDKQLQRLSENARSWILSKYGYEVIHRRWNEFFEKELL